MRQGEVSSSSFLIDGFFSSSSFLFDGFSCGFFFSGGGSNSSSFLSTVKLLIIEDLTRIRSRTNFHFLGLTIYLMKPYIVISNLFWIWWMDPFDAPKDTLDDHARSRNVVIAASLCRLFGLRQRPNRRQLHGHDA